ncbi:MAG: hypothetical protein WC824_15970 [Bacteroidota bacterium]|jgi:hypothetical protein
MGVCYSLIDRKAQKVFYLDKSSLSHSVDWSLIADPSPEPLVASMEQFRVSWANNLSAKYCETLARDIHKAFHPNAPELLGDIEELMTDFKNFTVVGCRLEGCLRHILNDPNNIECRRCVGLENYPEDEE